MSATFGSSTCVGWSKRWASPSAGVSGSHHIYAHPRVPDLVNLQDVRGQAKPYQVRQLMRLVELYDLKLEAER